MYTHNAFAEHIITNFDKNQLNTLSTEFIKISKYIFIKI